MHTGKSPWKLDKTPEYRSCKMRKNKQVTLLKLVMQNKAVKLLCATHYQEVPKLPTLSQLPSYQLGERRLTVLMSLVVEWPNRPVGGQTTALSLMRRYTGQSSGPRPVSREMLVPEDCNRSDSNEIWKHTEVPQSGSTIYPIEIQMSGAL